MMLRTAISSFNRISGHNSFLNVNSCLSDQVRTTYMLKRKFAPKLHRKGATPKNLLAKHYVYELIRDTNTVKKPDIEVVLTAFVDGVGNLGDKVTVRPLFGYNNLLLPGLAVYATPENIIKYKRETDESSQKVRYSSSNALLMMKTLSRHILSVVMNKDHPWTIQPWHIKASFRKSGFVVPEHAITLPEQQITGPDMSLENKQFYVTVTINKSESVDVRCRLHHWSTEVVERLPYVEKFWDIPTDVIHPEFADVLQRMQGEKETKNVDHCE
ncbi:39S ribosomal protein L9, mitochondrial [Dendroctonus ponderosae]|uniref:Large ribosomal subunit protein bL9m n=2 Tax=Dendroctonus ponderosae TaxID=77166 RepID=J3JXJ6_DENPD|nr:39S ribosomal protein L9, mitochondrial [Dendroctonus ponderosae]AEE62927.1 unknown [Dendroctonus ponderosae]KAH1005373.1 hypothetical protein HUJ04_006373 [Dendroctonus ponderosae]